MCEGCFGLKGNECEAHPVDWPVGRKKHWDDIVVCRRVFSSTLWHQLNIMQRLRIEFSAGTWLCKLKEREGRVTFPVRPNHYYLYVTCKMSLKPTDGGLEQIQLLNAKYTSIVLFLRGSEHSQCNKDGPIFCDGMNLDGRLLKNVSDHFSPAMIDAACLLASFATIAFSAQVNRCHVFACPTWPQAKAMIWQLNDFGRWKHKIGALSSWKEHWLLCLQQFGLWTNWA